MNSNRPMDWDWIKAFPQTLKDEFKSMKITVNWEKPGPPYSSPSSLVCRCC
ncbi:hypothetical protein ACVV4A_07350 [Escherichia coli]